MYGLEHQHNEGPEALKYLIDLKHKIGLNGYCLDIELIGLEKSFPQLYEDLLRILLSLLYCVFVPKWAWDGRSLLAPVILVLKVFASLLVSLTLVVAPRLDLVALRLDSFPVVGSVVDSICFL